MPYYPTTSKKDKHEIVCQLPLSSELFTQAIHPNEPVIAVGMASGHVQSFRLPAESEDDSEEEQNTSVQSATGTIQTQWRTRRHKGSCRTLDYSLDGQSTFKPRCACSLEIAKANKFKHSTPQAPTPFSKLAPPRPAA